jgi:uncharacterized membrane protein
VGNKCTSHSGKSYILFTLSIFERKTLASTLTNIFQRPSGFCYDNFIFLHGFSLFLFSSSYRGSELVRLEKRFAPITFFKQKMTKIAL